MNLKAIALTLVAACSAPNAHRREHAPAPASHFVPAGDPPKPFKYEWGNDPEMDERAIEALVGHHVEQARYALLTCLRRQLFGKPTGGEGCGIPSLDTNTIDENLAEIGVPSHIRAKILALFLEDISSDDMADFLVNYLITQARNRMLLCPIQQINEEHERVFGRSEQSPQSSEDLDCEEDPFDPDRIKSALDTLGMPKRTQARVFDGLRFLPKARQ
ncbi:MAG: hypothetical protein V1908_02600 [Candidatus Peregrinibacteria bacterium]